MFRPFDRRTTSNSTSNDSYGLSSNFLKGSFFFEGLTFFFEGLAQNMHYQCASFMHYQCASFMHYQCASFMHYQCANCGGCKTTALPSIIEKKVNKNSENIKRNTVI